MKISVIIVTYNRLSLLKDCIDSLYLSSFKDFEIIVVDNCSSDGTSSYLKAIEKEGLRVVRPLSNLMAGGGRNFGANYANANFLLFIDDDNVVDQSMLEVFNRFIDCGQDFGLLGPLMKYYSHPNIIWWADASINKWSSKTTYHCIGLEDTGQLPSICEVGHIPNIFLIKRQTFLAVGGVSEDFVMHYEESDLAEKVKRCGKKVLRITNAVAFHNVPFKTEKTLRHLVGESDIRAYYTSRNRLLYMRRNAGFRYVPFVLIFSPIFLFAHLFLLILNGHNRRAIYFFKGYIAGLTNDLIWGKNVN